jgi:transposase
MTSRNENVTEPSGEDAFSRRKFLTVASAGVAGTVVTGRAVADTREVGADLSGHGERSKFVHLAMLPEAGRGSATSIQAIRSIRKRHSASWSGLSRPPICITNGAILAIPI